MQELMTKERLNQYRALQDEVKLLTSQIKELEAAAEGGVHRYGREPKMFEFSDRVGAYGAQIADLKAQAENKLRESMAELEALSGFINSIDDAMIRVVFTQRYMFRMTWQQVAVKLHGNTADSVRMLHNRFLQRLVKENKIA